jgi:hypothetical protein
MNKAQLVTDKEEAGHFPKHPIFFFHFTFPPKSWLYFYGLEEIIIHV